MRGQDIHKQQQQRDNELRTSRNSTCLLNYISSNRNLKESISSLSKCSVQMKKVTNRSNS